jgi:inosine-uridine nucleoside N-ribohydrolase
MRVHVDTDLGDNPDDAAALVMLLGWEGVDVVGVTTVDDPAGRRVQATQSLLDLVGLGARLPVARGDTDAGGRLLASAAATEATIMALGPCTNLAALELREPETLGQVPVVLMGGWAVPPPEGYPPWGPARDRNVQRDVPAALTVFSEAGRLTLVPCGSAVAATLSARDLPALAATGRAGRYLVRESVRHALRRGHAILGARYPGLPADLVNFQWDPVAAATAVGWDGCVVEARDLVPRRRVGGLAFDEAPAGVRTGVVTAVDGDRFREAWLDAVRRAQALPR